MKTLRFEGSDRRFSSMLLAIGYLVVGGIFAFDSGVNVPRTVLIGTCVVLAAYYFRELRFSEYTELKISEDRILQFTTGRLAPHWCDVDRVEEFGIEFSITGDGHQIHMRKRGLSEELSSILLKQIRSNQSVETTQAIARPARLT